MGQLRFTEEELMAEHDYAVPQLVAGQRLHGGFDAEGNYLPPRSLHRPRAIENWARALRARGGDLLQADASLLAGLRYPNAAQQKLLLREGLGQPFWNTLTITGKIEARGKVLAEMTLPDFQRALVEDVSQMAVGHLNRGLLEAHGLDEGGEPERGIGGHDVMWFALRDLAFGRRDWPDPEVPDIARPESQAVEIPGLPVPILRTVYFLANLLMIEFRAERGFSFTENLLRDPELFRDRRAEAERAAEIVTRIRLDEELHVQSLRLYLGELRHLTFETASGGVLAGREVVDPLWEGIVHWATEEQPVLAAARQKQIMSERIAAHPEAERVRNEFDALEAAA